MNWSEFFPNGLVDAHDVPVSPATLNGKKILLYFASAHCGPCHEFCPKLIEFRNRYKDLIEVIFVSQDTNEQAQFDYMQASEMPWLAVKWHDYQLEDGNEPNKLMARYNAWGTPSVAVLSKSGELESGERSDEVPQEIRYLPEDEAAILRKQMDTIDAASVKAEAKSEQAALSDAEVSARVERDKQFLRKRIDALETLDRISRDFKHLGPSPSWLDLLCDYYQFERQAKAHKPDTTAADADWNELYSEARNVNSAPAAKVALNSVEMFEKQWPEDVHFGDAQVLAASLAWQTLAATVDETIEKMKVIVGDAKLSESARGEACIFIAGFRWQQKAPLKPDEEKLVSDFLAGAPTYPRAAELQRARLNYFQRTDPAQFKVLLAKLTHDPSPGVATMAQKVSAIYAQPLDLKFTSANGQSIDSTKLRGKVVLIDFWATWCGPCMLEVPEVRAAYDKWHSRGLEVIGISLDSDLNLMQKITKEKGMLWPQYFDGKAWDNDLAVRYGVTTVPTIWLVDRSGLVVDADLRDGMPQEIAQQFQ